MKPPHAYKGYPSSYNVNILNSFNPELQLEDTESAIRNNLMIYCVNKDVLNLGQFWLQSLKKQKVIMQKI